jgi:hypothetical protein
MELSSTDRGGEILRAQDHGTIWEVVYREGGGKVSSVYFDHRCFAQFYEGTVGGSFYEDYQFGRGAKYVSDQLAGLRIVVEGEPFNQVVRPEEDW